MKTRPTSALLNNGVLIPTLGLGTFPMKRELLKVVPLALYFGYRAFDTASAYKNEKQLGRVLRFLPRSSVFITSKLSNGGQRRGNVEEELTGTLNRLKLRYLDLYLMHWPNPETYLSCWKQMEDLYEKGLVRAIGVCNFHIHHLEELLEEATVVPSINQFELHPLLTQQPLVDYCRQSGITVQAYSPLARMGHKLIGNSYLIELGIRYQKTVPQIILRWIVQSGHVTCPKTSTLSRLRQNIDIFDFELTEDEMEVVANLNEDYRVRHDPDTVDFSRL